MSTKRMKIMTNIASRDRVGRERSPSARASPTLVLINAKPEIKNRTTSTTDRALMKNLAKVDVCPQAGLSGFESNSLPHQAQTAICLANGFSFHITICLAFPSYSLFPTLPPQNPTYPSVLRAESETNSFRVYRLGSKLSLPDLAPSVEEPRRGKSQEYYNDSNVQRASTGRQVHGENECKQDNQE